jgi:hypothetical protein
MIGTTDSHDRILNKFGKYGRWKYLSRPGCGSFRQASIKTLPSVLNYFTEQLAPIKLYAEFLQLKEIQRV